MSANDEIRVQESVTISDEQIHTDINEVSHNDLVASMIEEEPNVNLTEATNEETFVDINVEEFDVDYKSIERQNEDTSDGNNEHSDTDTSDEEEFHGNFDDYVFSDNSSDSECSFETLHKHTHSRLADFLASTIAGDPDIDVNFAGQALVKYVNGRAGSVLQIDAETSVIFLALFAACILNNLKLVKLFVESGANVNIQTDSGLTPLHVLLIGRHVDTNIIDYLIDHGANLTLKDSTLQTPLYVAVKMKHLEAVRNILRHPCDVNMLCDYDRLTALMKAAIDGSLKIVNMLLANGADPNIISPKDNKMAIHFSVSSHNALIFKCLLEATDYQLICNHKSFLRLVELIIDSRAIYSYEVLSESAYKELLPTLTFDHQVTIPVAGTYKKMCLIGFMLLEPYSISEYSRYIFDVVFKSSYTKKMVDTMMKMGLSVNSSSTECIPPLTAAIISDKRWFLPEQEYYIHTLIHYGADVNYPQAYAPEALLCSLTYTNNDNIALTLLRHCDFATPDSVLNSFAEVDDISKISSEVVHLFLKLGMVPSTVQLLDSYSHAEDVTDFTLLTTNVCTLKQLCRISVRELFYSEYRNMSINEIMKMMSLPASVCEYLKYEDSVCEYLKYEDSVCEYLKYEDSVCEYLKYEDS